ncbi:MAG: hypothetical protein ABWY00_07340 [Dongiaceae bacterium]
MQRGIFFFVIQILVCVLISGVGLWALVSPRRFQHVLHTNFALLPEVRNGLQLTPVLLRFAGILLLWYGYQLSNSFHEELVFLGRAFGILPRN